jgi:hypothetical protein
MRNNPNYRDENDRAIASGVSSVDGTTTVNFRIDPVTDYLLVDMASSSNSATAKDWNKRDENDVPTIYGVSDVDGVTLVPIRTNSDGRLLTEFV